MAAFTHLRGQSARLFTEAELHTLLDEVLSTTMALQDAHLGCVQLYELREASLCSRPLLGLRDSRGCHLRSDRYERRRAGTGPGVRTTRCKCGLPRDQDRLPGRAAGAGLASGRRST